MRENQPDRGADNRPVESGSGPGLRAVQSDFNDNVAPVLDGGSGLVGGPTQTGPDCYDLIIAAVEPRTSDWFRPADWAGLIGPDGLLAVITHGDHSGGRFTERVGSLVRAAQLTGLGYLDRIVLVNTYIHNGTASESATHESGLPQRYRGTSTAAGPHVRVHDDLLVFVHKGPSPSRPAYGEASDD